MSDFAKEAGHWYETDGTPAYTIIGKNGKERATNIRDARKENLLPSVTTIMKIMAKPGLEVWKQSQILYAAATLPKKGGESVDDWCRRVVADSQEHGKAARDRGTLIHGEIEKHLCGEVPSFDYVDHCVNTVGKLVDWTKQTIESFYAEKSFANASGFAGKVDFSCPGFVADFKTTDKPLAKLKIWDEHPMQLAAYRVGLGMPTARCAIIYVHVDGECKLIELNEDELSRGWVMFQFCFSLWCATKNYYPGS